MHSRVIQIFETFSEQSEADLVICIGYILLG